MKTLILLSVFSLAAAHIDYYDLVPLEITALVKKPSDLHNFIDCLLDKDRCNNVYEAYRGACKCSLNFTAVAADAVKTACKKCTVDQKRFGYVFLQTLKNWLPYQYHNFRHKYDPDSKYFNDLEAELYKYKLLPCL